MKEFKISEKFIDVMSRNKILNDRQISVLVKLSLCVISEDCVIKNRDSLTPMSQKDIITYLNLSKSTINAIFQKLRNLNLLILEENSSERRKSNYILSKILFADSIDDNTISSMVGEFGRSIKIKNINEKYIEKYLMSNIELVEKGMRVVQSQYPVEDGFIDILAIDKNDTKCIIEIKIVDDCKDIIYQSVYYPTQFQEKIRMITICPDYSRKVYTSLQSLNYVEMKKYKLIKENDIVNIKIQNA